jgi:DNA polymerase-3 subunit delta
VGDNTIITREDVEDLSADIRKEPIYELSNAVTSRDCSASLVILNRLLDQKYEAFDRQYDPLQLLSVLANEFRKLIAAREFIDHNLGGQLDSGIPYPKFNKSIYPLLKPLTGKETILGTPHPYALYKTLARSATYQLADLVNCMHYLFDVDTTLKSTQISKRVVMESLIIKLCQV